jgi:hypothetical protein
VCLAAAKSAISLLQAEENLQKVSAYSNTSKNCKTHYGEFGIFLTAIVNTNTMMVILALSINLSPRLPLKIRQSEMP